MAADDYFDLRKIEADLEDELRIGIELDGFANIKLKLILKSYSKKSTKNLNNLLQECAAYGSAIEEIRSGLAKLSSITKKQIKLDEELAVIKEELENWIENKIEEFERKESWIGRVRANVFSHVERLEENWKVIFAKCKSAIAKSKGNYKEKVKSLEKLHSLVFPIVRECENLASALNFRIKKNGVSWLKVQTRLMSAAASAIAKFKVAQWGKKFKSSDGYIEVNDVVVKLQVKGFTNGKKVLSNRLAMYCLT